MGGNILIYVTVLSEFRNSARARRPTRPRESIAVITLVAALTGSLLTGCGAKQDVLPRYPGGLEPVCQTGSFAADFPAAPTYHGRGPHSLVEFVSYELADAGTTPELGASESGILPWPESLGCRVQLALCVDRVSWAADPSTTCFYRQQSLTALPQPTGPRLSLGMFHARYLITVREVKTRRVIATVKLAGQSLNCPPSVSSEAVATKSVYSWPTKTQWQKALGRYINGPA
jgi:hypothetical protein